MTDLTGLEDNLSISSESDTEIEDNTTDSETDFEDEDQLIDAQAPLAWRQPFAPVDSSFQPGSTPLRRSFGITIDMKPFQILKKFVTEAMMEEVCRESNRFVEQTKEKKATSFPKWKEITSVELWRFIGINLAMGIVQKPAIKHYWSQHKILSTPFFGNQMSRNRFEAILSGLHLHDKENMPPNCTDRYIKLGNFLPNLVLQFKAAVNPGEFLCLDESLLGFKGRLSFKQYNPMKRSRFGILFYFLVDCETGMVLDILPYQGKSTNLPADLVKELNRGGATVAVMVQPYYDNNHKVVTDNFFNSPALAQYLLDRGTFMLGTVQKRRKAMPKMSGKLKPGDVKVYSNGFILLERWQDRRKVVMMNTFTPHGMTPVVARNPHNSRPKPDSVLIYNKTMGAVDAMDKTIKPYAMLRKTYKWYKKVFFHLIDVAVFNSYRAYKSIHAGREMEHASYLDFLLAIIEDIMETCQVERSKAGRPTTGSVAKPELVAYHLPVKKGKADCTVCKEKGKRSQTQIKCSVCNVRLCLQKGDTSCFVAYHENLKKPKPKRNQPSRQPLANRTNLQGTGTSDTQNRSFSQLNSVENLQPLVHSTPAVLHSESMELVLEEDATQNSESLFN